MVKKNYQSKRGVNYEPLTIKDLREVLIPAMEKIFATKKDLKGFATKKDLEVVATKKDLEMFAGKKDIEKLRGDLQELKNDFCQFKNESLGNQDKILKDLETLLTEQKMDNFQKAKELKLWLIVLNALRKHRILTS